MKFFSDIRLLVLGIWLGASVFFFGVAKVTFSVLSQQHEIAGSVIGGSLALLNYGGLAIATLLILSTLVGASNVNKFWLWVERFLLLLLGAACAAGQFVIGLWIASIKTQMGRPIDEVAVDDPLRIQFNMVHEYSVWIMFAGMAAALIAFFIIANRRFGVAKGDKADPYDFSKEFKV